MRKSGAKMRRISAHCCATESCTSVFPIACALSKILAHVARAGGPGERRKEKGTGRLDAIDPVRPAFVLALTRSIEGRMLHARVDS